MSKQIQVDLALFYEMADYILLNEQGAPEPMVAIKGNFAEFKQRLDHIRYNIDEFLIKPKVEQIPEDRGTYADRQDDTTEQPVTIRLPVDRNGKLYIPGPVELPIEDDEGITEDGVQSMGEKDSAGPSPVF